MLRKEAESITVDSLYEGYLCEIGFRSQKVVKGSFEKFWQKLQIQNLKLASWQLLNDSTHGSDHHMTFNFI